MSRAWLLAGWLLATPALGAPQECEPLDATGFRDLSVVLRSGVDRGDVELVAAVNQELDARIGCLVFAPEPHAIADVLVLKAIAAYAAEGDWQTPMAAAVRIWPGVDRVVSARHPMASWEPPESRDDGVPANPRDRIYVNGLPADTLPPTDQLALVQRTDGTWWNSVWASPSEPLPSDWAQKAVVPPPHIGVRAITSLGLGPIARHQTPDFQTDWLQRIDPTESAALAAAGNVQLLTTFYSPFGLYASGSLWLSGVSPGLDAHATGAWAPGGLVLGLGVGTSSVETFEGPPDDSPLAAATGLEEIRQRYMLRYFTAVARLRGPRGRWEVGLQAGRSANLGRWAGDVQWTLPGRGEPSPWGITLAFANVEGQFQQIGAGPGRTFSAGSSRAWLGLSRSWGNAR